MRIEEKRNQTARLFKSPASNMPRQRNCLYFGTGGYMHEFAKFKLCYDTLKNGQEFITEAKGKDGKIRDFVNLDTGEIVEFETDHERAKRHGKEITVMMV